MSDNDKTEEATPQQPLLRVVNPDATPEEIAALVAVFAAVGAGGEAAPERRTPEWSAPRRLHRTPQFPGPGGWRASALPR